ncbi:alpha/beta fold hydrolase [Nisaea sp.]|uniref:alpha/beta fold hydrolase n=1 Tax=Nisaea sp. TaxID=2024842 RepID=UPI003B51B196
MPRTEINGMQLHWELDGGAGAPIVLVHGSWGDHHNWAPIVPALSTSFRVLTYDRRGHSGSERPEGQGSVLDDVADLAALVEHLDHFPAHVIGNSFGASIVLRLAGERPELFRSLIVHEPPLFGLLKDEPKARSMLVAVQERIAAVVELLTAGDFTGGARQFVETIAFGPGAWENLPQATRDTFVFNAPTWLDEVRDPDALEIDLNCLRKFSAPALLTVGEQSPPFFPLVVDRIADALAQAERYTFAEAGHVPHLSHPEEHVRVVAGFIQGAAVSSVGT